VSDEASRPFFGPGGTILFLGKEGESAYIYEIKDDGTGKKRVIPDPVIYLIAVSPDGRWVIAYVPYHGEETTTALVAYPMGDGSKQLICSVCQVTGPRNPGGPMLSWSGDQKSLYFKSILQGMGRNTLRIPLRSGEALPRLPGSGLQSDRDLLAFGQFYGEVEIINGLRFRSQVSVEFTGNNGYNYHKANANSNLILPNGIDEYYGWGVNPLLENYFSFNKHAGIHQISATLGNTYRKGAIGRSVSLSGSNFPNDDLKSVIAAPSSRITGGFVGQSALLSYFARVNYTLMDKYLLTASIRRDGSYVFSKDSRFGNFPSVGLGWKINEEGFMKGLPILSQLKLRVSYGKSGNSNIPQLVPSVWKGQSNNIVYSLGDAKDYAQGATVNSAVNPNNRWETTKQFDVGLDAGFLEDRVILSLGYYDRRNEGLLTYVPLPLSTGIGGPYDNPGSILKNTATASNKGIEVSLGYQGSVGGFRYSLNANVAHNTNKVISLGEGTAFQRGGVAGGNLATKTDKGHPIGSFYGYVVDHVAVDQADVNAHNAIAESTTGKTGTLFQADLIPGDIIFKDLDGDGQITSKDQTFLGSPIPKWNYGANVNLGF